MFDKLYLENFVFSEICGMVHLEEGDYPRATKRLAPIQRMICGHRNENNYFDNLDNIEILLDAGHIEVINLEYAYNCISNITIKHSTDALSQDIKKTFPIPESYRNAYECTGFITDLRTRLLTLVQQVGYDEDIYPILLFPFQNNIAVKKKQVLNFILSKIPEPTERISWEHLREFKSDPDTMRRYYALIKWINDVARKDFNLNEIEEEYNFLYHEYANQYKIHKLKHNLGTIEIFVTAAIDCLSGQMGIGKISTSLFSIWKQNLSFSEAETKFTGREVAYIHKANEKFNLK